MTPAAATPRKAYSYTRFSTAEQKKGKSFERQTEAPERWCTEQRARGNNVELDTELTLHDLGVSAFRGKNAGPSGALGQFLKVVHAGQVVRGSYLLIETFDRLSRETAYDAQETLRSIINAGVTVVTLMDGKEYNLAILRLDPLAIIYAILLMSRAHEESATKALRVADAWKRKRQNLRKGELLTAQTPGWITLDKERRPKVIPARAKIVQLMFQLYLGGLGKSGIAEEFNKRKIPTFRLAKYWRTNFVAMCLANRAVLGEFQPHKEDHSGLGRKRVPQGEPISNYFPMIVDRRTFDRVQAKMKTRQTPKLPGRKLRSMLAGLSRCAKCDGPMVRIAKASGKKPRLVCARARVGAGCPFRSISLCAVEQALIDNADSLVTTVPDVEATIGPQIAAAETALKECENRLFDLATLLDDLPSRTVAERIQRDEAERDRIKQELDVLRARAQRNGARLVKENAKRMRDALKWHVTDPSDIVGLNTSLRECFEKVVVDYNGGRLNLHWRHGALSTIPLPVSASKRRTAAAE